MKTTPVTTSEHTTDAMNAPEVNETEALETAAPAETPPAATEPETSAEREPGTGASSDEAAHEAELAARRAAVLAGDYSAWSADLSLSEPVTPTEPEEQKPAPEAVEAVQRIARAHGTPAAIGRDIVFHGDGYPVRGVIIGSEGNSLAIRVESGMECLVPPDVQIQYLDAQGHVIWTSADLQDQEPAPEQPREPEQPQAAGQADPEPAEESAQENDQSSAALQPESAEDAPSADAGAAAGAETEREDEA